MCCTSQENNLSKYSETKCAKKLNAADLSKILLKHEANDYQQSIFSIQIRLFVDPVFYHFDITFCCCKIKWSLLKEMFFVINLSQILKHLTLFKLIKTANRFIMHFQANFCHCVPIGYKPQVTVYF